MVQRWSGYPLSSFFMLPGSEADADQIMTNELPEISLPSQFSGIVRLFPLSDLVLFPGIVQALHIFEPRYRELMRDALAADELISMTLYRDQEQELVGGPPEPVHDVICIGRIMAHKELDDGRFNLLLMGVKRARIVREIAVEKPYRMAEVEVMDDACFLAPERIRELRSELVKTCQSIKLFDELIDQAEMKKLVEKDLLLGLFVDLISFSAGLDCRQRQALLESSDVEQRCRKLIQFLQDQGRQDPSVPGFPPDFSVN